MSKLPAEQNLLVTGTAQYLAALRALKEYQGLVFDAASEALKSKLEPLFHALGAENPQGPIDYTNPEVLTLSQYDIDDKGAWLASRVCAPRLIRGKDLSVYAGITFERRSSRDGDDAFVSVMFCCDLEPFYRQLADRIRGEAAPGDRLFLVNEHKEVALRAPLTGDDAANLCHQLELLLDLWISFWPNQGGLKGFLTA